MTAQPPSAGRWHSKVAPARVTFVVGAGGLLGTALTANLRARPDNLVLTSRVGWTTRAAHADLAAGLDRLDDVVSTYRVPWRIAWCAGAGVTGTTEEVLAEEVRTLTEFLHQVSQNPRLGPGSVFLASSAGGLYAGSGQGGPYDETDVPRPISPYGRAKLAAEQVVTDFACRTGNTALIGRIANLYGPGQNLSKSQGLISHLCRADLTRQPLSVYVSMDTIRDYLYVDDCAGLVSDMLDRADSARPGHVATSTGSPSRCWHRRTAPPSAHSSPSADRSSSGPPTWCWATPPTQSSR